MVKVFSSKKHILQKDVNNLLVETCVFVYNMNQRKGSRVIGEDKIVILHQNIKQLCKSVIK